MLMLLSMMMMMKDYGHKWTDSFMSRASGTGVVVVVAQMNR
jgi:hypothetical protein